MAKWLPVSFMLGSSLISYIDRNALAVLAPMILAETGMTTRQYGFAISCFSVAYMIGNPLWGLLLDRKGLRLGMAAAVGMWSLASFAHALVGAVAWVSVPIQFAVARLALGAGEGATFPGAMRTAGMTLPREQHARGISIGYSGGSLGAIVTPLAVTPIAIAYGWRSAFWTIGAIGMVWVFGWLAASRRYAALDAKPDGDRTPFGTLAGRPLQAFLVLYSFGAIPLATGIYAAPIFLSRNFGMSQATLGSWLWIPPLGWELGYLFWGWMADRSGTGLWKVIAVLAVSSAITALVPFATGPAIALALFFLSMFVAAGFVMCSLKYGLQHYPADQAFLAGVGAGAWSGLVALLMPIVGALFDGGRYSMAFVGVACVPFVGTAIWAALSNAPSGPAHPTGPAV